MPPVVASEPLEVPSPPRRIELQQGVTGWLQYLMPVVGSLGALLFIVVNPRPIYLVSGVLFALGSVGMGAGMAVQQRLSTRRRTAGERARYLGYLARLREEARGTAAQQREAEAWRHPEPGALAALVQAPARLWERRRDHADFLVVRAGTGDRPLATAIQPPGEGDPMAPADPVCADAARRLVAAHSEVPGLPLTVNLSQARVVGVTGPRAEALDLARAVLAQTVAFHAPDDVRLGFCLASAAEPDWEWAKWVPHTAAGVDSARRMWRSTSELAGLIAVEAAAMRHAAGEGGRARLILVVDGVTISEESLALLRQRAGGGVTLLALAPGREAEPGFVDVRLEVARSGDLRVEAGTDPPPAGRADRLGRAAAGALARKLAGLRLSPETSHGRLAEDIPLLQLLGVGDLARLSAAEAWRSRPLAERLRVPIGIGSEGDPVVLDLKESALNGDGPHGLVVGATGSGKSELLRTVVTGLALTHPPDLLAFVLVDFKGGAAFAGLGDLPHLAGSITNLADDLALVDRMHDALFGEMRRRQELLRHAGNLASIRDYQRLRPPAGALEPMPYLLLIVDEFGELLASRPDFIDLFVAVGRLGRSLGMHLLLSSQQLEEGRLRGLESHLSYRIALRTFSAQESRAVLGVPDAYELPPVPGSAYLKVGTTVFTRFRAAMVSEPYAETPAAPGASDAAIRPFSLGGPAESGLEPAPAGPAAGEMAAGGPSVLDLAVSRLRSAASQVHQVWLPPLEPRCTLDSLLASAPKAPNGCLVAPLGLLDRPAEQRREVLSLDFSGAGGHLIVVGAPLAGKSTLLRTLIAAFAVTHTPAEAQFYVIDFGGGTLSPLAGLPHVGGVCGRTDQARVARTVSQVGALLDERERRFRELGIDSVAAMRARRTADGLGSEMADVFLVIDNWTAVRQEAEELEARLQDIAVRGLGYGVHLVLTAGRWLDVRSALREAIGGRLELRVNDPTESAIDRKAAGNVPRALPGRGLTAEALHFQTALPRLDGRPTVHDLHPALEHLVATVAQSWAGPAAPPVRVLPAHFPIGELPATAGRVAGVPIGISESDLEPVHLDLIGGDPHLIVLGDGESGKTTLLRTFLHGLTRRVSPPEAQILLVDYRRTLLGEVDADHLLSYAASEPAATAAIEEVAQSLSRRLPRADLTVDELRNRTWWQGPEAFVVVDDYDLVVTPTGNPLAPLIPLLAQARDVGLHVVVARRSGGAGRALYETLLLRLKELSTPGVMLSGDPQEGPLLGNQKATPQPPGRGLLVRRRLAPVLIQVASSD